MSIIARDNADHRTFVPAPAGLHPARLADVVDLGTTQKEIMGNVRTVHRVRLVFQIDKLMEDGRAYIVSAFFNPSLHEKSRLRPFLESWLQRRFTDEEAQAGIDLLTLVDRTALVQVMHTERNGKVYADVSTIIPLPEEHRAEFPDYCAPDGTVLLPGTAAEAERASAPIVQGANGTIAPAAEQPPQPDDTTRMRLIVAIQRRGAQLYNGAWPEVRKTILATLELPGLIDSLSADQLRQVEHYLAAEADENSERTAMAA